MPSLYCNQHNTNHTLTTGQIERVVYALSGEVASAQCEPDGDRIYAGQDGWSRIPCPLEYLELARDIEGYGELVESSVESRIACARLSATEEPSRG